MLCLSSEQLFKIMGDESDQEVWHKEIGNWYGKVDKDNENHQEQQCS